MTLSVIDAHFHLWDPQRQNLPWLSGIEPLNRPFTIEQLEEEYHELGVDFVGGVYVEVDAADANDEDAVIGANTSPKILAKVLRSTPGPLMRVPLAAVGIRYPLHTHSGAIGDVLTQEFREGLALLEKAGMTFDLVNREEDVVELSETFTQFPQLRLVVDHLANVTHLDTDRRRALETLARNPHTYVKVSGDNPVDRDVVRFVAETFGPKRVMWASNWPVVKLNSSLREHFETAYSIFGGDDNFFMNNARRAYGISVREGGE